MHYPWQTLSNWEPFQVDALGLITLLGAEEIDSWVGRLVPSRWVEYMPLLAMYVTAGDRFRRKVPSFRIYNLSLGIHTTDSAAWFSRWIQCQTFEITRSIVYWETVDQPRSHAMDHLTAAAVSICLISGLLIVTILSCDLYGLANSCALITSIITRAYIIYANRSAINHLVRKLARGAETHKIIIIGPDSKAITMFVPSELIVPVFIHNTEPAPGLLYQAARWLSWLAFGVHVVTLGMATLVTQIYTVTLIIISSILICVGFGCADTAPRRLVHLDGARNDAIDGFGDTRAYTCWIGWYLKATVFEWPTGLEFQETATGSWKLRGSTSGHDPEKRSMKRMDLYAWLDLTEEEVESLVKWDLIPHKRGTMTSWNDGLSAKRRLIRERHLDMALLRDWVSQALEGGIRRKEGLKSGGNRSHHSHLDVDD